MGHFDNARFDTTILSGIEPHEHMEIHKNFINYFYAKKKILKLRKPGAPAIVNRNSPFCGRLLKDINGPIISYGTHKDATCRVKINEINSAKMSLTFHHKRNSHSFDTRLLGEYNALNMAAAFLALTEIGIHSDEIIKSFEDFSGVEGRLERYSLCGGRIAVIDYAHTPDSLQMVIELLREIYPDKDIVTVFGCGGEKTRSKRPLMGKIASENSKKVYITNDNPRRESPLSIFEDIVSGVIKRNYVTEMYRKSAISMAIKENPDSVILLAGKGAENYTIDLTGTTFRGKDSDILKDVCKELNFEMEKIQ
jgi:UDP-N-acetylmuramoyl-L-alanyl-D-glutamate--2,6-diaminopimelate ligase